MAVKKRARLRVAIYVRISKDKEGAGLGVERQRGDCLDLAARLGWEVVPESYVDNDIEASSGKPRPAYLRLLEDMRQGRVDAVLCWHTDRLVRRPDELEDLIKIADEHDVAFAAVQVGDIDLSTASGRLVARLLGAAAKYETELKAERQSAQLRQRATNGLATGGGSRPFGYSSTTRDALVPDEADVVRTLVRRALTGETVGALTVWLNETKVPTVRGGRWQPQVVKRLLMSPSIAGLMVYKGEHIGTAKWEPIISEKDHRRLVELLTYSGAARNNRRVALLTGGIALCGRCGFELVSFRTKSQRAYGCRTKYLPGHPGFGKSCGGIVVGAERFENDIAERVLARLSRPAEARRIAAAAQRDTAQADSALDQIGDLEDRLRSLGVDYADGLLGRVEFLAARDRVTAKLDKLRRSVGTASVSPDVPVGDPTKLAEWWEAATLAKRRALISHHVDEIKVDSHSGRRSDYDPGRFRISWR